MADRLAAAERQAEENVDERRRSAKIAAERTASDDRLLAAWRLTDIGLPADDAPFPWRAWAAAIAGFCAAVEGEKRTAAILSNIERIEKIGDAIPLIRGQRAALRLLSRGIDSGRAGIDETLAELAVSSDTSFTIGFGSGLAWWLLHPAEAEEGVAFGSMLAERDQRLAMESLEISRAATGSSAAGSDGAIRLGWKDVSTRLERLRTQGEKWTSHKAFAEQIGCSPATIYKAVEKSPSLHFWAQHEARSPKAQSLIESAVASSTALNPADDAAIREFVESADPETRAWFLALSPEDQLSHLEGCDPDQHGDSVRKLIQRREQADRRNRI